ncbi:hypothetical protein BCR43DRAFT_99878 [Syncephalastrum racemosum]|uniref:ATPase AAA-type core domain-containing protein n=1 Tax=Syncephalastrum racemosum TaxID=13706 RepID=A0A1X2H1B2_SYNRA|nr:hypothetical protein BCR43DRAFT_99878 [Syncephalastrum racemosum]
MILSSYDNASAFRTLGMPVAKSVLVHGVQGVGKTTMIKTVADQIHHTIFELSLHTLMDLKDEFEQEHFKNYNPLHLLISKAITTTPALIVIRDIDILKPGKFHHPYRKFYQATQLLS